MIVRQTEVLIEKKHLISINGEKKFKKYSVVFFWVEGEKLKFRIFFPWTSSLLCSRLRTRSAHCLSLQHFGFDSQRGK